MFTCGATISGVGYPFVGRDDPSYCGYPGFVLSCNYQTNITNIDILGMNFRVLEIDPSAQTMRIVREDIMIGGIDTCPTKMTNTTLDYSVFDYAGPYMNYTFLYGCLGLGGPHNISCGDNIVAHIVPGEYGPGKCNASVVVPGPVNGPREGLLNGTEFVGILRQGFLIRWKIGGAGQACTSCTASRGRCGYVNQTVCFCPDPPYTANTCRMEYRTLPAPMPPLSPELNNTSDVSASDGHHPSTGRNIGLYVAGAVLGVIAVGWSIFSCLKQQQKRRRVAYSPQIITKGENISSFSPPTKALTPSSIPWDNSGGVASLVDPHRGTEMSSCRGVKLFNYAQLEQATGNFDPSRELGYGAFGTVYYGVLSDGRMVAVKRLYEHGFKRVEQFTNEVEILTRLRHTNLVTLYGYTSRKSRELLLVYEYIPNGTVADHLHGKRGEVGLLSWPIRLNIAIETSDALAYLHRSDIIHRDVKTTNILLDKNFHVKVADFGLSRLFPNNVTHVSTAPQGTPGYVDPEYYQCYQVTEKSDVYSFGVVLVELISSLQAVDTNRQRRDINLSNMAVSKILNRELHELVDPNIGFETSGVLKRTVTLVAELAFRCLQQDKDMRPSMEEVLQTLKAIQNEELNEEKLEIVDMVMDEDESILKSPLSPEYIV
ncbi:LEAF RUST 10 DISEASE-RESISTANCE LOCUS RECEPTOR-LIKE PROTEIN KINASE-like 1.3 [Andrographis paniculata]|uniref:LEAF RUST 10 DISEASE-RESISTANCE LOCUS RECEPTOR-LIKE PROTEIN KINASE-like 1.3 n=1 Tax=Andrographis paniculata TaxID=175694 RepID=UPI0021E79BA5|nr:LEAF RUST 10 DISEASE-RESISTANCE LOCUS RECEPTOR-LIKE PROTEIN KINASE-like 1.3 [Andrographis paniculata]